MRSPKIGGKRIGDVELDGDPVGRGVRPGENQRVVQHRLDVERAEMRLAAAQEFAHATHDAAGVVDLRDEARQIGVGALPYRPSASAGSAGRQRASARAAVIG